MQKILSKEMEVKNAEAKRVEVKLTHNKTLGSKLTSDKQSKIIMKKRESLTTGKPTNSSAQSTNNSIKSKIKDAEHLDQSDRVQELSDDDEFY